MNDQERVLTGRSRKMSHDEIMDYFKDKASSINPETQRLINEIKDFKANWFEDMISKFFDGREGQQFLKEHEDEDPDAVFDILMKQSDLSRLYSQALRKKLDALRGEVQ